ncbi:MAG: hypothetical protein QME70_10080, partial [Bacillota bacterium]|nr:hypothetical protein [Bacillota bacterium]
LHRTPLPGLQDGVASQGDHHKLLSHFPFLLLPLFSPPRHTGSSRRPIAPPRRAARAEARPGCSDLDAAICREPTLA